MNGKKIKILVVDDDEIVRGTFADVFRQEGFEVIEAEDGLIGLDKATKEIPDVILTGIIMPRMDGFSFKESLSKNVITSNIPVIMLSHMGREEDRRRANELGIKDFVIKGMITPREIVEKVHAMFDSGEYNIRINTGDPDALKLAKDFYLNQKFECPNCGGEMVLKLKVTDVEKKEFIAKFVCPKCG